MSFDPIESGKVGRARMKQLADQLQERRQVIVDGILGSLQRAPTELERIAAAHVATLHTRCEMAEAAGRNSTQLRQMLGAALVAFSLPVSNITSVPGDQGEAAA